MRRVVNSAVSSEYNIHERYANVYYIIIVIVIFSSRIQRFFFFLLHALRSGRVTACVESGISFAAYTGRFCRIRSGRSE